MIDYVKTGDRIRKIRKSRGMSQELLAESISISVTHMSHIETGTTKLSLQVLADISVVLKVGIDELLFGSIKDENGRPVNMLENSMEHYSDAQKKAIIEIAREIIRLADKCTN